MQCFLEFRLSLPQIWWLRSEMFLLGNIFHIIGATIPVRKKKFIVETLFPPSGTLADIMD